MYNREKSERRIIKAVTNMYVVKVNILYKYYNQIKQRIGRNVGIISNKNV